MIIRENVPILTLTTMRLGGNARYVLVIEKVEDIAEAYKFAETHNLPTWIMGGGANTIAHDEGFDGAILLNQIKGIYFQQDDELIDAKTHAPASNDKLTITAMGGENWDDLVAFTCEYNYSGIEAMSMIPGTVGAAPVQNIGAYGQDVAGVIDYVEAYDTQTQQLIKIPKSEMNLGYRHTRFNYGPDAGRFFIYAVTLTVSHQSLQPPFYNSLQQYLDEHNITDYSPRNIRTAVCNIRSHKLPDPEKVPSAGSFFKNVYIVAEQIPEAEAKGIPVRIDHDGRGKINTGWLIEACGLKGAELHGFKISDQAALVLINDHATSYADLAKARQQIIDTVYNKFGLKIEQEPVEIPVI